MCVYVTAKYMIKDTLFVCSLISVHLSRGSGSGGVVNPRLIGTRQLLLTTIDAATASFADGFRFKSLVPAAPAKGNIDLPPRPAAWCYSTAFLQPSRANQPTDMLLSEAGI